MSECESGAGDHLEPLRTTSDKWLAFEDWREPHHLHFHSFSQHKPAIQVNILVLLEKNLRVNKYSNGKFDFKIKCVHLQNNQTKALSLNPVNKLTLIS